MRLGTTGINAMQCYRSFCCGVADVLYPNKLMVLQRENGW
jgi:hypothetical protein